MDGFAAVYRDEGRALAINLSQKKDKWAAARMKFHGVARTVDDAAYHINFGEGVEALRQLIGTAGSLPLDREPASLP